MEKTIVVIDDDLFIRSLLFFLLKDHYSVKGFENGEAALDWLEEGNIPDLIITDLHMPKLDGFELLLHLSSSGYYENIPVIVLTGSSEDEVCKSFFKNENLLITRKPFNPPQLLKLVNDITGKAIPR